MMHAWALSKIETVTQHRHLWGLMAWWVAGFILLGSVEGRPAERYVISPDKSQFQFRAYSLLVKPLGTFHRFSGDILADAKHLPASRVRFVIDASSIDTGNAKRDAHLRKEDFLFVAQYPTISFTSTAISQDDRGYVVQGDLTIRGVTQPVTIPVTVEQRPREIVIRGEVRLRRKDFGITYNAFFNPIRNKVDVSFTIVGVQP